METPAIDIRPFILAVHSAFEPFEAPGWKIVLVAVVNRASYLFSYPATGKGLSFSAGVYSTGLYGFIENDLEWSVCDPDPAFFHLARAWAEAPVREHEAQFCRWLHESYPESDAKASGIALEQLLLDPGCYAEFCGTAIAAVTA
jgi:hypothetical protein